MSKRTNIDPRAARGAQLRWITLDSIRINPRAQREFSQAWASEILANFDIDKFQVPTVNLRDGKHYMVDGQHGTWAYREWLGGEDVGKQKIQVWMHEGLTEREEADLFLALNNKKTVGALPKFRSAVTAEWEVETDIDRIVRAQGCVVSGHRSTPGAIGAVSALRFIYRHHGPAVLAQTVATIRDAYGDEGYEVNILKGVGMVIDRYADIDRERLVKRLHSAAGGSKGLLNRAQSLVLATGNQKSHCTAAAIVETYNRGRGGKKLPSWWKATVETDAA